MRPIPAGELLTDFAIIAPVSGPRCRDCGAAAVYRDAAEVWAIENQAAYCPNCAEERKAGQ